MSYLRKKTTALAPVNTPPTKPIRGREADMVKAAGSSHYVFVEDPLVVLKRFLILGTEGSTMYESGAALTDKATDNLDRCLLDFPRQTIDTIVEVSERGAGIKNDTSIFALAVAAAHDHQPTRQMAFEAISKVCRTGTHFLMFVAFSDKLRGWGAGFKNAVWSWYQNQTPKELDYQLAKYRNREGWTHKDVFRLLHKPIEQMDSRVARLIGNVVKGNVAPAGSYLELVDAGKYIKDGKSAVKLLQEYPGATWEMLPTEALNYPDVWAYFVAQGMPITALVRNLNRLTAQGLLVTFSDTEKAVIATLTNEAALKKSRIHPLNLLIAKLTYGSGKSVKGSSTWTPNPRVTSALEKAFFKSFDYVEPTGKNFIIGVDVSGSMDWGTLKDIPGLTPRVVAAVLTHAFAKVEPSVSVGGFSHGFVDLGLSDNDSIDEVIRKMQKVPMGSTDCAVPVRNARQTGVNTDAFLVITDNETNSGPAHAANELKLYRKEINPKAKMIMAAVTATDRSITDPKDPLSLAIAGFDPALPRIVQEFAKI